MFHLLITDISDSRVVHNFIKVIIFYSNNFQLWFIRLHFKVNSYSNNFQLFNLSKQRASLDLQTIRVPVTVCTLVSQWATVIPNISARDGERLPGNVAIVARATSTVTVHGTRLWLLICEAAHVKCDYSRHLQGFDISVEMAFERGIQTLHSNKPIYQTIVVSPTAARTKRRTFYFSNRNFVELKAGTVHVPTRLYNYNTILIFTWVLAWRFLRVPKTIGYPQNMALPGCTGTRMPGLVGNRILPTSEQVPWSKDMGKNGSSRIPSRRRSSYHRIPSWHYSSGAHRIFFLGAGVKVKI